MIKLSNIKIPATSGNTEPLPAVARLLNIPESDISEFVILKRSVDARHKSDIHFLYTVALKTKNEQKVLIECRNASPYSTSEKYVFPFENINTEEKPVIVGMGPAGLFAAICLAEAGIKCIILERGQNAEKRTEDVNCFWKTGELKENSNVQFGEGGAGTFSDGKLTTGINDERIPFVIERLIEFGAPEDIRYLSKPHVGTDKLKTIISALREYLIKRGCDIRFGHQLMDIGIRDGKLTEIKVETAAGRYSVKTEHLILAPGNSARDTFSMLSKRGVSLSAKSFSVGVRIEHLQSNIDIAQYGQAATLGTLPVSDYKLAIHLPNGRNVYTFCVCPGGSVVAAASEKGGVVTNGMSEYARNGKNCNGGLLVSVTPDDFNNDPLLAIEFQRSLENACFSAGGGKYVAPAQLVGDFLNKKPSVRKGCVNPSYLPGVKFCNLWEILPGFMCRSLYEALPQMENRIRGFASPDAVLTAVETRSSCPVRINRENGQSVNIRGLYPCGEGAGYAGGIMSAAVDGIKAAEWVCSGIM